MLEFLCAAWIVVATNGMRYTYDKSPDPKLVPAGARIIQTKEAFDVRADNPYLINANGDKVEVVEAVSDGAKAKASASKMLLDAAINPAVSDAQFMRLVRIQYMQDADAKQAWDELSPELPK